MTTSVECGAQGTVIVKRRRGCLDVGTAIVNKSERAHGTRTAIFRSERERMLLGAYSSDIIKKLNKKRIKVRREEKGLT